MADPSERMAEIGVNIDTSAVPDHDVLMDCLRCGFDEVLAVGSSTAQAVLT